MVDDKKLESMEQDLKLMKGELKQSLSSVRDYLLNMELPSSEFATVLAALGGDGEQKVTMKGSFSGAPPEAEKPAEAEGTEGTEDAGYEEIREEEEYEPEEESSSEGEEGAVNQEEGYSEEAGPAAAEYSEEYPEEGEGHEEEYFEPEAESPAEEDLDVTEEPLMPEACLPLDGEREILPGNLGAEALQSPPKVNLLANLMHWVNKTKNEIGIEQLPIFLEVYGISGHLSPDLKELIMHMAEISPEKAEEENNAETWSRAMLSLHGILTGGDAPLHPVRSFWPEEDAEPEEEPADEAETEQPEDAPFKLKLVLPGSNGGSQEYCLDLKPEASSNGAKGAPDSQKSPENGGDAPWPTQARKKK